MGTRGRLLIDVDHARPRKLGRVLGLLGRAGYRVRSLSQWRSPSGRGWHLAIEISPRPATAVEVVALQLLAGSDPYREAYNLFRARRVDAGQVDRYWHERWNVLYD